MNQVFFQHYDKILMDDFIPSIDFEGLWTDRKITTDKQLKGIEAAEQQDIFLIGHRMSQETPHHSHNFYEVICILNGVIENCMGSKSFYMSSGDICIMNLASAHSLKVVDPDAIIFNICIKADEMQHGTFRNLYRSDTFIGTFLRENDNLDYLYFPNNHKRNLAGLLQIILTTYARDGAATPFLLASEVLQLFAELLEFNEYSYYGIDEKVLAILSYIEANYQTASLADAAAHFNYSESYLSRYIKKHTGKQITKIITEKKMENAGLLLQNTDLPIHNIASEVGYQSYSHFHKIFKDWYSETPQMYRTKFDNRLPQNK